VQLKSQLLRHPMDSIGQNRAAVGSVSPQPSASGRFGLAVLPVSTEIPRIVHWAC